MKIIDILNEKVNETLEDGVKFKYRSNTYIHMINIQIWLKMKKEED